MKAPRRYTRDQLWNLYLFHKEQSESLSHRIAVLEAKPAPGPNMEAAGYAWVQFETADGIRTKEERWAMPLPPIIRRPMSLPPPRILEELSRLFEPPRVRNYVLRSREGRGIPDRVKGYPVHIAIYVE